MTTPTGVGSWLNQRRLDDVLRATPLNPSSPSLRYLRKALRDAEITASTQGLVQWFRSLLGEPIGALPIPARGASPRASTASRAKDGAPIGHHDGVGQADPGARFDTTSSGIVGGGHRALLPLFDPLRRAIDTRWPDTSWRRLKHYVVAETAGRAFLAVKCRGGQLVVGLTLAPGADDPRLADNLGEFNWARMTKVARVGDTAGIEDGLLGLVAEARAHATGTTGGNKTLRRHPAGPTRRGPAADWGGFGASGAT